MKDVAGDHLGIVYSNKTASVYQVFGSHLPPGTAANAVVVLINDSNLLVRALHLIARCYPSAVQKEAYTMRNTQKQRPSAGFA